MGVDMSPSIRTATVIGGGIGGLTTAIALRMAGIQASVYEQASSFRMVGAGLSLWANAIHALRLLGLADAVIEAGSKIQKAASYTSEGRPLKVIRQGELEERFGEPTIAIHRAELHRILLAALPSEAIHLNKTFREYEDRTDSIIACFDDGSTVTSDLLIGADGIHSILRQQLLPQLRFRYAGYTAWRGVVSPTDPLTLGTTSETWGCGKRFGVIPISASQIYWFAVANLSPGRDPSSEERKQDLLQRFAGWHAPITALLEATPASDILRTDIYDIPPYQKWSKGRAVLIGDAAHPTTPNMGQGACMAIESAIILARTLQHEKDLLNALHRYENERFARTAWVTNQSWRVGKLGQIDNPVLCKLRNVILRIVPASALMAGLSQAAGYRV
jgi:2-polyprenyl-6-methoxyphenol hydroxylase-like FAD-dependent oxidoreductase